MELNLDGRDASGQASMARPIGGRHDWPFLPCNPIAGLNRPMSSRGMARGFDTAVYVAAAEDTTGKAVPGECTRR